MYIRTKHTNNLRTKKVIVNIIFNKADAIFKRQEIY